MMDLKILIEKKGRLVSVALVVIGAVIVFFSVSRTLSLITTYFEVNANLQQVNSGAVEGKQKYDPESFMNTDVSKVILEAVGQSTLESNVIVKNIGAPVAFEEPEYLLLTEEITLEGEFSKIMRCMDEADRKLGLIKISSLRFERQQSVKKTESLLLKVHFQMIKTRDDER
jgi:hypothetical protein